jgi:hypothetical protein
MRSHLTEDMLEEALEGLGSGEARRHLAECGDCALRLEEARAGLALTADAEVPEPPPLYWEVFRRQVGLRISEEAPARRAIGFVSLTRSPGAVETPQPLPTLPAWSALPPAEEDEGLEVLQALAAEGGALDAALPARSVAGELADLSDEESAGLVDALHGELGATGAL